MQNAASFKVGAAFLAGVALALGGAFAYLRISDRYPYAASLAPTIIDSAPPTGQKAADASSPSDAAPVEPQSQTSPPVKTTHVILRMRQPVSLAVARPIKPAPIQEVPPPPPSAIDSVTAPSAEQQTVPNIEQPTVSAAPTRQPHTVTIPAGTNLSVRLNEKLSTEHNFDGDTFRATLDSPLVMDGFIIADRGAKVLGRVVNAHKAGKMEGMAQLTLVLTEVATTDGQRLRVETNQSLRKGPSNTNEEVIKMAGGAALGAIIGAIAGGGKGAAIGAGAGGAAGTGAVLLGRGKPAVIENETRLSFELATAATITERLN